jgi:hypothetical protein
MAPPVHHLLHWSKPTWLLAHHHLVFHKSLFFLCSLFFLFHGEADSLGRERWYRTTTRLLILLGQVSSLHTLAAAEAIPESTEATKQLIKEWRSELWSSQLCTELRRGCIWWSRRCRNVATKFLNPFRAGSPTWRKACRGLVNFVRDENLRSIWSLIFFQFQFLYFHYAELLLACYMNRR